MLPIAILIFLKLGFEILENVQLWFEILENVQLWFIDNLNYASNEQI